MVILKIIAFLCCVPLTFICVHYVEVVIKTIRAHIAGKRIVIKLIFKVGYKEGFKFLLPIIFACTKDLTKIINAIVNHHEKENN